MFPHDEAEVNLYKTLVSKSCYIRHFRADIIKYEGIRELKGKNK